MKELFVQLTLANKLKEKGFKKSCFGFYPNDENPCIQLCSIDHKFGWWDDYISAPLYQQVIDWLREKHNLYIIEQLDMTCDPKYCYEIYRYEDFGNWTLVSKRPDMFLYLNPIENLNAAIMEALTLI